MFQAYYSDSEPLFKSIQMCEDATSMKTFMNMIFKQMEGMIGFCAIREGSNEIVGVLIASLFKKFNWIIKKGVCMHMYMISKISHHRIKKKSFIILFPKFRFYYLRFFAKFINSKKKKEKEEKLTIIFHLQQGDTLFHVMRLKNYAFARSRFIESIYMNKSVHIDIICVKPDHQRLGVGTALLRSCITRVSNFTSIVFGQFTSSASQTIGIFLFIFHIYYRSRFIV